METIKSITESVAIDLSYIGSITIDRDLIDAANFVVGEKVQKMNNGTLQFYIVEGKRASGR